MAANLGFIGGGPKVETRFRGSDDALETHDPERTVITTASAHHKVLSELGLEFIRSRKKQVNLDDLVAEQLLHRPITSLASLFFV